MTYTIPTYKVNAIVKKITELNSKIRALKGTEVTFTVSMAYEKTIKNDIGIDVVVDVTDVVVDNPIVSMNGWSFLAITEHSKEGNIVMKKLYNVTVPEKYLTSGTYCEHCNTNRYRKYTYLVYKEETGEIHQVGSTCLTAYLGFDVSLLLLHASLFSKMNGMMETERDKMVRRGTETQPIEMFLKRTLHIVDLYGYVSAKKAREHVAADGNKPEITGYLVWGMEYEKTAWKEELFGLSANTEINETYEKVLAWVKSLDDKSDYIHNIKTIVERGYVTNRTATTAASIIGVYFSNLTKQKVEDKIVSNHFGKIKERINVDLILKKKNVFEGRYGMSTCYTFVTNEGNLAIWFTNTNTGLEEGARYIGKATITKHTEYKGVKQTNMNRCSLSRA